MTAAEHLAEAERLLAAAADPVVNATPDEQRFWAQMALAHAVIAVAAELGVPHAETTAGGAGSAAQAQAG